MALPIGNNLTLGPDFWVDPSTGLPVPSGTDATTPILTLTAQGLGTVTSPDQINVGGRTLNLGINITAATGTLPTLTLTIQGKDIASGTYYTILTSTALGTTGFTLMSLSPGLVGVANLTGNAVLPHTWRVSVTVGGTGPAVTATIGASVV